MNYPNATPPNSPWALHLPTVPGHHEAADEAADVPTDVASPETHVPAHAQAPLGGASPADETGEAGETAVVEESVPHEESEVDVSEPTEEVQEVQEAEETGQAEEPGVARETEEPEEPEEAEEAEEPEVAAREVEPAEDTGSDAEAASPEGVAATVAPRRPGEVAESPISLWAPDQAAALRERFAALLPLFVDDPTAAVSQAATVVNDAVDALSAALRTQGQSINPHHGADRADTPAPDTESLRIALRDYRSFLDRLLAL